MTRPRDITIFVGLATAASLLRMVTTLIVTHFGQVGVEGSMLGLVIVAVLLFWTVRGRSLAGRLVATAWLAFCIIATISGFATTMLGQHAGAVSVPIMVLALITLALNGAAVFFVWTRASTDWLLAKPRPVR